MSERPILKISKRFSILCFVNKYLNSLRSSLLWRMAELPRHFVWETITDSFSSSRWWFSTHSCFGHDTTKTAALYDSKIKGSTACRDSLLVERRTRDRKVASSNLGRSGRRIFFSRVNFVCWLLFGVRSTPVSRWFCQKCRWQVTHKHAYTLDPTNSEWADYACCPGVMWEPIRKRAHTQLVK